MGRKGRSRTSMEPRDPGTAATVPLGFSRMQIPREGASSRHKPESGVSGPSPPCPTQPGSPWGQAQELSHLLDRGRPGELDLLTSPLSHPSSFLRYEECHQSRELGQPGVLPQAPRKEGPIKPVGASAREERDPQQPALPPGILLIGRRERWGGGHPRGPRGVWE